MQKFFAPHKVPDISSSERESAELPALLDPYRLSQCSSTEARDLIAHRQAEKLEVLPLGLVQGAGREIVILACAHEPSAELQSAIRFICSRDCRVIRVDREVLKQAIYFAYLGSDSKLRSSVEKARTALAQEPQHSLSGPDFRATTSEAGELLCSLVDYAISHCASDLHLIPLADGLHVKLRVNGVLHSHAESICSNIVGKQLTSRIKVLSQMDTTKRDLPQDGAMELALPSGTYHLRVGILPTVHGEKVALRFHGSNTHLSLDQLGLMPETLALIQRFGARGEGALLLAGATGSGKTSSLYAILSELSKNNLNCVTLEDPVEIRLPQITQCSIKPQNEFGYVEGLRSVLRQDPDVIMLGEIRDSESAKIALQAAITGHLLLSTLHARDFYEIFLRLEHLDLDRLTIAQACSLVMCQKLLPALCAACCVTDLPSSNQCGFEVRREVGCSACDYTGFDGRILLCDSLECSEEVRDLIIGADHSKLRKILNSKSTLRAQAKNALLQGKISAKQFASLTYSS